ncbi:hypothetical protein ECMP0210176_2795 [Escherichia coli MP021017.6]|nr:hypothetical protein ECMP0210176_2795 [Escherichia coli MP021017.6]EMU97514.1 hypothetical protein ECMP0210172_2737 [Escherichia coli MP021017.2]EMV05798.1 hypothetical protein ECMP02101710_2782 [Escherichia coli MP021017.10]EMV10615.1 hypothetical protein ECMP02101711_2749 [Escherichia coli MP021017.11]EMV84449.1 hypothetical protein EC2861200_2710 [Escherichia coli 2861200]
MVATPPEIIKNLFFDEFYWRSFRTNRDREARDVIDPPKDCTLGHGKKLGDIGAAHQFGIVIHFCITSKKLAAWKIWKTSRLS